jgi:hypothetical protein
MFAINLRRGMHRQTKSFAGGQGGITSWAEQTHTRDVNWDFYECPLGNISLGSLSLIVKHDKIRGCQDISPI